MKGANVESGEKQRTRRLVFAAAGMFFVSLCVFGSLFYLQGRATSGTGRVRKAHARTDISVAEKQKIVARASVFRDKWRPWAFSHRAELQQMLSSAPDDFKSFNAVWEKLPANPRYGGGFTFQELVPNGNPLGGAGFGWAPLGRKTGPIKNLRPDTETERKKMERIGGEERTDEFQAMRDVVIAVNVKGLTWTSLWASGRITQRVLRPPAESPEIFQKARAAGRKVRQSDIFTPHREVVPPYDFLLPPQQSSPSVKEQNS